jgi:hypothetical protein
MSRNVRANSSAASGVGSIPISTGTTGTSGGVVTYPVSELLPLSRAGMQALENAVYGHIQAIRALGRTQVSASEIAAALSVPVSEVMQVLVTLNTKGVKIGG